MPRSLVILICFVGCLWGNFPRCAAQMIWDRENLDRIRTESQLSTTETAALQRLKLVAKDALALGPFSVTDKSILPPSGDRHDYLSHSRYWWPDPEKEDGLPYIRRDGVVNRKLLAQGDRNRLGEMVECVQALALAGYLLRDSEYSERAAELVRVWFLDSATRMNPNLDFAQGVPGRAAGRAPGIIDTRSFILVLDAVALLEDTEFWTATEQKSLEAWFREFTQWLQEDELGIHESAATNNHGSWYDAQLARYALFSGDENKAREIVRRAQTRRLAEQFDAEGWQAAELKRTRSLHYSMFNISALVSLARVGDQVGVDLWDHVPDHGCGMRKSLDLLVPYLTGQQNWPHDQLEPYSLSPAYHLALRLVSQRYGDRRYADLVDKIPMRHVERDFAALLVGN